MHPLAGTTFEQEFRLGILIRGVNGDAQTLVKSDNPALSPEMHNRSRKLRCSQVSQSMVCLYVIVCVCICVCVCVREGERETC